VFSEKEPPPPGESRWRKNEFRMAKKTGDKKIKSKEIVKSSKPKNKSKKVKKGEKKVKPEDKVNATLDKMRELLQSRIAFLEELEKDG